MSTVPTISTLPPAPQRTQTPEAFATTADTFVASLATLVSETNTTVGAINNALAGALVTFNAYQSDWSAGTYASGDVVRKSDVFYISLTDSNTQEPPDTNWQALNIASSVDYDNSTSGLTATDVQAAIDEVESNALTSSSSLNAANLTGDVAAARITDALNAGGSAPIYACRAWVNFDGTGTVSIRESGNVSSITDNGTGIYTVNLTTAMPDANYSVSANARWPGISNVDISANISSSSAIFMNTYLPDETPSDASEVYLAIFR